MASRQWTRADDLLRAKLKDIPLGKDIKKLKEFEIEGDDSLLVDSHLQALTRHFDDRMPWQR